MRYTEIEEPPVIRRHAKTLAANLRAKLAHTETRSVGDPSGTHRATVYFQSGVNDDALYWSGGLDRIAWNRFGFGKPGGSEQLLIWLEFNLPIEKYSRRFGGAFLRDRLTDRIVLAHRGIVTLGRSRLKKSLVFRHMNATLREAETSAGVQDFLLIGQADSSTLVEDLRRFIKELRHFARQVNLTGAPAENETTTQPELTTKLRDYFDEFSGTRTIAAREEIVADCYHGAIVQDLRAMFKPALNIIKSREVDLAVVTANSALLFEVKTSVAPQAIYSAIGQLMAHAPAVADFTKLPVVKVAVLPMKPSECFVRLLSEKLNISVVTFRRSAQGRLLFHGLDDLK